MPFEILKITPPEDQVTGDKVVSSEEDHGYAKAITVRLDREIRQSVKLLRRERFEVGGLPQREHHLDEIHGACGFYGDRNQIEKYGQQSELVAEAFQNEKNKREPNRTEQQKQFGGDGETPKGVVRTDVGCVGGSVSGDDQALADEALAEEADDDEIQETGNSGVQFGRSFDSSSHGC